MFLYMAVGHIQQGMPMRQPMMTGGQQGMMAAGMGSIQQPAPQTMLPQPIAADHQNGKNNVQLDPFGAF